MLKAVLKTFLFHAHKYCITHHLPVLILSNAFWFLDKQISAIKLNKNFFFEVSLQPNYNYVKILIESVFNHGPTDRIEDLRGNQFY